jgi:hypothetical protein
MRLKRTRSGRYWRGVPCWTTKPQPTFAGKDCVTCRSIRRHSYPSNWTSSSLRCPRPEFGCDGSPPETPVPAVPLALETSRAICRLCACSCRPQSLLRPVAQVLRREPAFGEGEKYCSSICMCWRVLKNTDADRRLSRIGERRKLICIKAATPRFPIGIRRWFQAVGVVR